MLTRLTIWMALAAYTAGEAGRAGLWDAGDRRRSRLVWTLGFLLYVAHVGVAFGTHHGWSHTVAYQSTALQTGEVFGVAWGGGIFVNYAFSGLWLTETLWWWVSPTTYQSRSQRQTMIIRGTFLFMILNGAVIFVDGPMRWVGVLLVGVLVAIWTRKY